MVIALQPLPLWYEEKIKSLKTQQDSGQFTIFKELKCFFMDYTPVLAQIANKLADFKEGKNADYIPELAKVNPDSFGVSLITLDLEEHTYGESDVKFSIQSIAKVMSLILAYQIEDGDLWKRVGVEPPGTPFNSLVQLEADHGIPRNPLINAGALVICDVLLSRLAQPEEDLLSFIRMITKNPEIDFSLRIAQSEKEMGYRNAALVNLMKDLGNIRNDCEAVLDFYFKLCSIEMCCRELAHTFLFLANDGMDPISGERIIRVSRSRRVNAIMQLCGFYDEAGEFSFKVGLPGKSGVGGGIVVVRPDLYSMALWSPRLNAKGNSALGMRFLEEFTTITGTSIY